MIAYIFDSLLLAVAFYLIIDMGRWRLYRNGWIEPDIVIGDTNFIACLIASIIPIIRWTVLVLLIVMLFVKIED